MIFMYIMGGKKGFGLKGRNETCRVMLWTHLFNFRFFHQSSLHFTVPPSIHTDWGRTEVFGFATRNATKNATGGRESNSRSRRFRALTRAPTGRNRFRAAASPTDRAGRVRRLFSFRRKCPRTFQRAVRHTWNEILYTRPSERTLKA